MMLIVNRFVFANSLRMFWQYGCLSDIIINQMQNNQGEKAKSITIPRYADKYKSMLQQSASNQQKRNSTAKTIPAVVAPPIQKSIRSYFYYKIKTIGVGAHSFVYLVQQQESKMIFAQKSVTIAHSKEVKQDLIRQIKILSLVEHQNIIKLYHFYATETHINLVMEYAEDSLFNLKQRFLVFKEKEIVQVLRQLLNGLTYLHKLGIVHADVKLQNIMIANGTVKLCDFGYAHQQHLQTCNSHQVVGTLEYLPPEYAKGIDSGTKRDIWAVGILAFEMLVGKTPFEGLKENEKWSKLIKTPPEAYIEQLLQMQKQLGIGSERIEQLVRHILCAEEVRWSAERLLKLLLVEGGNR